jgi:hypothetical protein
MPHSGDNETSWRGGGGVLARTRSSGGDGAVPIFPVRRGDGEGTAMRGQRCVVHEEDDAADRWGRSASEMERARERDWQVGLACQREREGGERVSGCARGSGPAIGPKGGRAGARERGGGRGMGQIWPSRGERAFSFSFYFL